MSHFEVYTDGSAKGAWGAWAYLVLQDGQALSENSGRERTPNSNRMEFQAVIQALVDLPVGSAVIINTDCRLLIENVRMFPEWQAAGWLKSKGRKIANVDQFKVLHELLQKYEVTWKWVRAHSGNIYNERCDQLCRDSRTLMG